MRAFSLINTLLLLSALSKVSRIKIYLLYQICCIKMEEEFQKYEAEINSGSEGVEDTSSEDEESHYIFMMTFWVSENIILLLSINSNLKFVP